MVPQGHWAHGERPQRKGNERVAKPSIYDIEVTTV